MRTIAIAFTFLVLAASTARAQEQTTQMSSSSSFSPNPAEQACIDALLAAKGGGEEGKPRDPIAALVFTWPTCGPALQADADFVTFVDKTLIYAWHRDEAKKWSLNEQHVVYAYAAIWVLTIGFVAMMFLRQQKLKSEIARLAADLAAATKES